MSLPQSMFMNALSSGPQMNSLSNIVSGPNSGDYWNHSSGLEKPDRREEGPFPIQGNIGSLLKQEANQNYAFCSTSIPFIGGSPNCTAASSFKSDIYTSSDTCGSNCELKYPESFGGKNFGLVEDALTTNSHGLHAYKNVRASAEGSGPSDVYGCYEWTPRLTQKGNSCVLDQYPAYQQVGDWTKLAQNTMGNYTYKQ